MKQENKNRRISIDFVVFVEYFEDFTAKCQLLLSSSETESDFKNKMAIWGYISSTTDSIKRNAPDPTSVKDLYWSSYDSIKRNAPDLASVKGLYWSSYYSIKRNAPDLTSVKGLYWSSYDNSRAAVTIIHNAVRVNTVDKLYPYLPDVETRSNIATNLAKKTATVAVREGVKLVPGGSTVYDIVSQSIPGEKKAKEYKDLKELKDKVHQMETEQDRMKHELNDYKRLLEQHSNRKPEDVNRFFTKPEDAY